MRIWLRRLSIPWLQSFRRMLSHVIFRVYNVAILRQTLYCHVRLSEQKCIGISDDVVEVKKEK